jgi:hypothetical protein
MIRKFSKLLRIPVEALTKEYTLTLTGASGSFSKKEAPGNRSIL